jgi:nucleoside-diphosphate-sugar epimerase
MMRTILVTAGAGLIGANLVNYMLLQNANSGGADRVTGNQKDRVQPYAAQGEAGNVLLLAGG